MTPTTCTYPDCEEVLDPLLPAYVCDRHPRRLLGLLAGVLDVVTPPPLVPYLDRSTVPPTTRMRRAVDGGTVVPGLASSLEAAVRGELRFTAPGPSSRPVEAPLPYNAAAAAARDDLVRTLRVQADAIAAVRGLARPLDTMPTLARWLGTQVEWLATREDGAQRIALLTEALVSARRWIESRTDDQRYRGQCTGLVVDSAGASTVCGAALYVRPGAATITCRTCGAEYPADDRRRELLAAAHDQLVTATEAARALQGLGVTVAPSTVRWWVHRGLLTPAVPGGRPRYRVGDVWSVAHRQAERQHPPAAPTSTPGCTSEGVQR